MKKLATVLIALMIVGCASLKPYDANQHGSLVRMENLSRGLLASCSNPYGAADMLARVQKEAEFFYTYTNHRSNKKASQLAEDIKVLLTGMELRYSVSMPVRSYCVEETQELILLLQVGLSTL